MKPQRIQRKRTKGWRMPPNTVYVGRPTKWGNPFKDVDDPVDEYRTSLKYAEIEHKHFNCMRGLAPHWALRIIENISQLKGKNLACWCTLDQPCHVDVLLELANK